MATTKHRDFDGELAHWLSMVTADQAQHAANLFAACEDAKVIKDPHSPAYTAAHERIDAALTALGY